MTRKKTLPGMRFHRLVTVARVPDPSGVAYWECLCDCGKTKVVGSSKLWAARGTKSCGCLYRERIEDWRAKRPCVPIFSEEDKDLLNYSWRLDGRGYPRRHISRSEFRYAHHDVCLRAFGKRPDWSKREVTDHRNRNKLDNRRENLRITNQAVNTRNREDGQYWSKNGRRFTARISVDGKKYYLGQFDSAEEARNAALRFRAEHLSGL